MEITNVGAETVQLRSRVWHITDAQGERQQVRGGVVGETPKLAPGQELFSHTSGGRCRRHRAS